jgi:hypothetical protein
MSATTRLGPRKGPRKTTARAPAIPESTPREGADTSSLAHDEWLLDEALSETFPASDPIAPAPASGQPSAPSRAVAHRTR